MLRRISSGGCRLAVSFSYLRENEAHSKNASKFTRAHLAARWTAVVEIWLRCCERDCAFVPVFCVGSLSMGGALRK